MSTKNSLLNNDRIGVLSLLGVTFVVLKLTGYIDWSWWYITLPFWGGLLLLLIIIIFWLIVKVIEQIVK